MVGLGFFMGDGLELLSWHIWVRGEDSIKLRLVLQLGHLVAWKPDQSTSSRLLLRQFPFHPETGPANHISLSENGTGLMQ